MSSKTSPGGRGRGGGRGPPSTPPSGGGGGGGRGGGGGGGGGGGSGARSGGGGGGSGGGDRKQQSRTAHFKQHISKELAQAGLASGVYLQGKLRVNPKSKKNAYVSCAGVSRDVLVQDEVMNIQTGHRNRAIHGDVVVLEMLPEDEWPALNARAGAAAVDKEATIMDFCPDEVLARLDLGTETSDRAAEALAREELAERLWRPNRAVVNEFKRDASASAEHWVDAAAKRDPAAPKQPVAKVVAILRAGHPKTLVGALEVKDAASILRPNAPLPENVSYVFFTPHEPIYPKLIVPRVQLPEAFVARPLEQLGRIFRVDLVEDWPAHSKMAYGENARTIGEVGNIADETEALLLEHCCNHGLFGEDVLAPLRELLKDDSISGVSNEAKWHIPEEEISRRRDLRAHRIFTIDPSNAKDLDDALHITGPLPDGTFEVGVHIADVSYFLAPGTALDAEAARRATSVYLVQKVVPMLPPILCEQLCSLNPNVDRLAFSVIFRMDADGSLSAGHKPWFGRTVIRSCCKLDYATAQRMVDGDIPSAGPDDSFLPLLPESVWQAARHPVGHEAWRCAADVCAMHRIAMARRQIRKGAGALSLHGTKLSFQLDADGNPSSCQPYPIKESNQLIEEYMLLANTLVAEKLLEGVGRHAFLRSHPRPLADGLKEVEAFASARGLAFDASDARSIQSSLNAITCSADPLTLQAITALLMVPMKPAIYLPAGRVSSEDWRHFALNIPYYTHFTSPIRRYADVCVHRLLDQVVAASGLLDAGAAGEAVAAPRLTLSDELYAQLDEAAEHCNTMKENSMKAQRRSDVVFLAVHISDRPRTCRAVVVSVGDKSFTVLVPELGVQERMMVEEMPGVTAEFSEAGGKRTLLLRRALSDPETGLAPLALNTTRNVPNVLAFTDNLEIGIMSEVMVQLSAKMAPPPVDVRVALIGPAPKLEL